ncbi:FAD-binding and (Fe-S)-binding domain-containing protein [Actinopolymorpha alba]|uniref:FAD-binding and (Fe-S)-binding domain-containing protein n=1 Tax=Actinopolymorpha alba TaxID=533267 RepID=UPI00036B1B36|nr:FAD-binding and (Fe-S)-binding domain-containing protein [Actinopolymorpha alba]
MPSPGREAGTATRLEHPGPPHARLGAVQSATKAEAAQTQPLRDELAKVVRGAVRFDSASRAMYAADASNYRHPPIGVVQPRDVEDVLATLDVCHRLGVPILPRGAGTSIGGQAINTAVVLDFSRHLNNVLAIDPESRRARVQPGVVLDDLRKAAGAHGLTFGPDPSTHNRCTLGGMIGNNACGSHSVAWGKTVDNVASLDVVLTDGTRLTAGPTPEDELARLCDDPGRIGRLYRDLRALRDRYASLVETTFPDLTRRVSGYNLDQLLPAQGFDLAKALVGTEGTCATLLEAEVQLVEAPAARALAVLGFPDQFIAADNVVPLLDLHPLTIESVDAEIVSIVRSRNPANPVLESLPPGGAWLYVETGGDTLAEAEQGAQTVARVMRSHGATSLVVSDPAHMKALWRVREEGAGSTTRLPDGSEAYPGWEDAAVPPQRLGAYLRGFDGLLKEHGRKGIYYGHFGDGCIHVRIDFDLLSEKGVQGFRRFMEDAADLVTSHGGSLSGEHGDGQARSELLDRMYPPEILTAFREFKAAWDPGDLMNPRRIVEPAKLDEDLRVFVAPPTIQAGTTLAFAHDKDGFFGATRRCMGVGKCVSAEGGVMCPSYRATREEMHSTRGRARLLFEMANGEVIKDGWRSPEVREALDLCLSCKGCKTDCPVNVDMASYKAEFLSKHYAGRVRPASHYSMGFLPLWLRLAAPFARLINAATRVRPLAALAKKLGGIAPERDIPAFAPRTFVRWFRRRPAPAKVLPADAPRVLLWPDSFTNAFDPDLGMDAVAVLESLGYRVEIPDRPVCCGLTWVSTGQLGVAKRVLRRTLKTLKPWLDAGVPVVGLEPSCTALFRGELTELLPDDADAATLKRQTKTFAELLAERAGDLDVRRPGQRALVQVHCHQHADLGFTADRRVLAALGVEAEVLDSGCCGLAGNFGFEKGHYDVSMACAERVLLPAVRAADDGTVLLADGFSCRTQVRQAGEREPAHLAQIAARALGVDADSRESRPPAS